jgi:4'-phosphopantetheinyl transferase
VQPELSENEIHLWLADLDRLARRTESERDILSVEELVRAARFRFEGDRRRYLVRHFLLRELIGLYIEQEPVQVELGCNLFGKPQLLVPSAIRPLEFNLSHSVNLAVYAFARRRRVGVDVEAIRRDLEWKEMSGAFLHPAEALHVNALPRSGQLGAFFEYWTLKEALLKAHGTGFAVPPNQIDLTDVVRGRAVRLRDDCGTNWVCRLFEPRADYQAAVVIEGS